MPNNEWGDFQTPLELAEQVIATLPDKQWGRVLEPTCGTGNFLTAAKCLGQTERVGVEIQPDYAAEARRTGATVIQRTIFDLSLGQDTPWSNGGPLLVVGNPPWVTNAELGTRGSINLPPKSNFRHLSGIEALTGASNFDLAEFIWLKLILELMNDTPTIALLSKTHAARNVVDYCHRNGIPISDVAIRRIDAKRWFGASVDACLLTLSVGGEPDWRCAVYPSLDGSHPEAVIGFADGLLVANIDSYDRVSFADGQSPWEWRQGVKHDAIRVMELSRDDQGQLHNRAGQRVDIEPEWVYPLLNATDLHRGRHAPTRSVILTQRSLADDTERLASTAPSLWAYLIEHREAFEDRRSSIYRNRPRFSMFGIGDYTFAPWKVAVSGLHTPPRFVLLAPAGPQPIVVDDTCYFLGFDDGATAAITFALMGTEIVGDLLLSLSFRDAKRPVTKKLLQRIDLAAVLERCDRAAVADRATHALQAVISSTCVHDYAASISSQRLRLGA